MRSAVDHTLGPRCACTHCNATTSLPPYECQFPNSAKTWITKVTTAFASPECGIATTLPLPSSSTWSISSAPVNSWTGLHMPSAKSAISFAIGHFDWAQSAIFCSLLDFDGDSTRPHASPCLSLVTNASIAEQAYFVCPAKWA